MPVLDVTMLPGSGTGSLYDTGTLYTIKQDQLWICTAGPFVTHLKSFCYFIDIYSLSRTGTHIKFEIFWIKL